MSFYGKVLSRAAGAALTATLLFSAPAIAQGVTIIVNGQTMTFDQPPIERAGRVFVPLRGVFERLGASVVYSNGQINATGNGRTVSLQIGSTNATVNGQPVTIDVAPFLVGPRTLVPLRFIAQSLGATVNYNDSNRTVTINGGGGGPPPPPAGGTLYLIARYPAQGSVVHTNQPRLNANFTQPAAPGSLRVYFDGRDITQSVYVSSRGFNGTLPYTVPYGGHSVRVTGTSVGGAGFDRGWTFTTAP
ncbi:MAG: copper amine oxidase N-terminal domain-containing protein [Candidatus Eremiobacteraeota bacterium]|nr:copper amine oxidase N-terminal domain-containing protein [Candidatus Eremiobacteraeota bacterium]